MAESQATVATKHAGRYQKQLCKHWGHRLEVEESDTQSVVKLRQAILTMTASRASLHFHLRAHDADGLEAMKHVVISHLDRFAFRETPLEYLWIDA